MRASFKSLKGKFLIATPSLLDSNFKEGVVFLCEHNQKGAFGFLINNPLNANFDIKLNSDLYPIINNIKKFDFYIGGPINANKVMLLAKTGIKNHGENRILKNVILIDDILSPSASKIFSSEKIKKIRIYVGCAGWDKMQLEYEISLGLWLVLDSDVDMIFSSSPDSIWKINLARAGGIYNIFSKMPSKNKLLEN